MNLGGAVLLGGCPTKSCEPGGLFFSEGVPQSLVNLGGCSSRRMFHKADELDDVLLLGCSTKSCETGGRSSRRVFHKTVELDDVLLCGCRTKPG